jgi:hypothetical protein
MAIFTLNGKALGPDTPFEYNGIKYNSVTELTQQEKDQIGIVELESYPNYDQRFWWGVTPEGDYIPKRIEGLIDLWVQQTNEIANQKLSTTDWMIIRQLDNGTQIPNDIKILREEIRNCSNEKVEKIKNSINVGTLEKYLTSQEYYTWPS